MNATVGKTARRLTHHPHHPQASGRNIAVGQLEGDQVSSNRNVVEDHENGVRYGGRVLSLIAAPDGWFVGTQVERINRKSHEIERDSSKVFPLLAWALVDEMLHGGDRQTVVHPLFLSDLGIMHAGEFRWRLDAGVLDGDWRTFVAVDVIPAPGAVADLPAYGEPAITSRGDDPDEHRSDPGI